MTTGEDRCPTLARWLERASATHPLRFVVDDPEAAYEAIGNSYEELLSYLEALKPNRLDRKRRDFWRDEDGVIELRSELVIGYRLGRGGIDFEFGDEGQPRGVQQPLVELSACVILSTGATILASVDLTM